MSALPVAAAAAIPNLRLCHLPPSFSLFVRLNSINRFNTNDNKTSPFQFRPKTLSLLRNPNLRSESLPRIQQFVAQSSSSSSSMATSTQSAQDQKPFSVLFVCLGNICRSPAAEAVFRDIVRKRGLEPNFRIDSAGTIGYHEGDPADPRMRAASKRRGIEVTSISRPIRPSDFREFDLILAMDMQNRDDILSACERWSFKESLPADAGKKVKLMCSYCKRHTESEVPDPYYGGPQGFENVLDILEDACEALLDSILAENSHISVS